MSYLIGIDGGGTKTTCLFQKEERLSEIDSNDNLILTGPGTNPHAVGFPEMQQRILHLIAEGMSRFSVSSDEITAICCGLAGAGRKEEQQQATQALKEIAARLRLNKDVVCAVESDSYIALRGALPPDVTEGILVISGTGSNAIGLTSSQQIFKSGGWGHLLGDEGSGYQIGLQALNMVTRAYDKRGKETALTQLILQDLKLSHPKQLVTYIYSKKFEKKDMAHFARIVIEAAKKGDSVAFDLLITAANELALHVESLHHLSSKFDHNTPITTTGSIFSHSQILKNHFIAQITQKSLGRYQEAYSSPAAGAVVIAREITAYSNKAGDGNGK